MRVRLIYFAWVRERIGRGEDVVEPPAGIGTVADLLDWMAARDAGAAAAFADRARLRAALDERFVPLDTSIGDAREIAVFPPVTGG